MKQLRRIVLLQFYLHEAVDIEVAESTAFLGPNGSGKSSTLDAIQIAMLGGNLKYARFNAQSVSSKQRRSLASYCLGQLRHPEKDSEVIGRARDDARSYIILVFGDGTPAGVLSAGICVEADAESEQHEIKGLFVLPGQDLKSADCIVLDGDDRRPMPYADFRETARARAKQIGREPTFTDKSSEYVSELLYALNGERMPDPRRFMSAFVKSMTLKNVDSIDQFVREYVVEPNPVDIAAFRKQVEQFVALRELVRRTKARIARVSAVLEDFQRAASAEQRIAALKAVRTIFQSEWLCEKIDGLDDEIKILNEQRALAEANALQAKAQREAMHQEVTTNAVRIQSDQQEQRRLNLQQQIQSGRQLMEAYQQPEITRANRLVNALRDLMNDDALSADRKTMAMVVARLVSARSAEDRGTAVAGVFQELDSELASLSVLARARLSTARKEHGELTEESEATRRRIAAASQTGRLLNDGAALLLEMLDRAGMRAQPISALARISDPAWAPALEAYLGGDRDALVVLEGETREAVRLLREARRRGLMVDGAAVVQPHHLLKVDTLAKGNGFVVALFETENDTVRRFLWQKFGNMRLVETEAELETHSRAISRDGMLSQGGLTKSIRVAPNSDLRIGKKIDDTSGLSRDLAELQGQLESVGRRISRLEALERALLAPETEDDEDASGKLAQAAEEVRRAEQELEAQDLSHLDDLRAALETAKTEYELHDAEFTKQNGLAAGFAQQIEGRIANKAELERQLPVAREEERTAIANALVDTSTMDQLKDDIERRVADYRERLADVESKVSTSESRLKSSEDRASIELSKYVQDERLDVQVAAMHWHDRHAWAATEKTKLADTELHKYENEAEHARLASEETLRSDIAMSLNDRFREMELERRERNKILESCPAFTGGERYRFVASVVPEYESLVKYILQIAKNDQSLSLFGEDTDEINETLHRLVDAAAETGNAGAVLDYRQFYTFDLDILVDGKRVDRMSNRQGSGSNGEHIAPMYVAAGAALAKAYRLHNRRGLQNGTGLICLDEAFHGMDTTNAVATARFLQNLGLQLIMAGPELERTKLAPVTQTIYDLDREGVDLLMERTLFKPAANALMVSDMPGENPEVMANAYQQLGLEPPPASEPFSMEKSVPPTKETGNK